jgi:hypothetical protein
MRVPNRWYGGYTVDVEVDDVVVRKGLDLETLPLPSVKFAFESARDAPVGVRLTERLPESVQREHVAVHADYGGQGWTAFEDGRLVYTGSVPPGDTVVTLLMVWLSEPDHIYGFLGQPHLRVTSNPNAPSLRPVGVETDLLRVDGRFASDEPFERIRAAVERALTTPADAAPDRPESGSQPVAAPPPGGTWNDTDGAAAGTGTTPGTSVTRPIREALPEPDNDWPHPVVRGGAGELEPPDEATVDELLDQPVTPGSHFVRVETRDSYHGGGAVVVAQELANAFEIDGRKVSGDGRRDVVDVVVVTDQSPGRIVDALVDRPQVVDVFVSPVTAEDEEPEPIIDDVVETFEELAAEFDPVDAAELEAELDETEFPGPDGDEFTIAELVEGEVDAAEVASDAADDELHTLQEEIGRLADHVAELEAELDELDGEPADVRDGDSEPAVEPDADD